MSDLYDVFGLTLRSELALPGLRAGAGAPDGVVRRGAVTAPEGFPPSGIAHEAEADADRLAWLDRARLRVTDREITVDSADDAFARQCVVGPGLGVLLHRRGVLVLHGAALDVGGRAVVLLGNKGAGKSTTAAALLARGARLLADDLVALDPAAGVPTVLPGPSQMKLWPEAAAAAGLDVDLVPFFDGLAKGIWTDAPLAARPAPLAGAVVLEWGTGVTEPLAGPAAFGALFGHVYAPRFLGADVGGPLVGPVGALARDVPVTRVVRERRLADVAELADRIASDAL